MMQFQRRRAAVFAPDYLATADVGVTAGTAASAANVAYLMRLDRVPAAMLLSTVSIFVSTAGGNFMVGLYTTTNPVITATQAFAASFARVAATLETVMAGAGVWQDVALVTPYTYQPGTNLWVAYGGDAIATLGRESVSNVIAPAHAKVLSKTNAYASNSLITPIASLAGSAYAPIIRLW